MYTRSRRGVHVCFGVRRAIKSAPINSLKIQRKVHCGESNHVV
ncbi:hypothetical protein X962_5633 [Burkholderia pseudomallei MSHR7343]|nr:hypothetical protein X962_5633 [Burkholderia pseudomallei MSHR7343]